MAASQCLRNAVPPVYHPRRPRSSPLYRLLEEHFERFCVIELITESVAENMLGWPHSGFHGHLGPVISGDEREELKRTARYGARAPIALSRLSYDRELAGSGSSGNRSPDRAGSVATGIFLS